MNERLLAYLRSLGLAQDATNEAAWDFFHGLRGLRASIANALNYAEADQQARTNCDLMLRALGHDPANPGELLAEGQADRTRPTPPNSAAQDPAGSDGASVAGDMEEAQRRGAELERQRRTDIQRYATVAGTSDDLVSQLLEDGTQFEEARQRIWEDHQSRTRASVPRDIPSGAPAGHSRASVTGVDQDQIACALMQSRGVDPHEHWHRVDHNGHQLPTRRSLTPDQERAVDYSHQFRSASLADIVRLCARLDGVNLPMGSTGLMRSYIEAFGARGFSTSALSAVYTTSVNAELMMAYQAAADSTAGGWIRENDVADFRPNERARMVDGGKLKKLPRGGTADHAEYSDIVETFKIARYAKQFIIDDQDIQDNNFGGMTGFVPADFGASARELRPDLIYSLLMANAAMRDTVALFHANHSNLTGSAALAVATLKAGRAAMMLQTEGTRNLGIMARFLIVPPTLHDDAQILVRSRKLITGSDVLVPEDNPNAEAGLTPVADPRLENGVTDPTDGTGATVHTGSSSTWFLAGNASQHTIECAYLKGTGRAPTLRSFILDKGQWGIGWDIELSIGAKALDWRALSKFTA